MSASVNEFAPPPPGEGAEAVGEGARCGVRGSRDRPCPPLDRDADGLSAADAAPSKSRRRNHMWFKTVQLDNFLLLFADVLKGRSRAHLVEIAPPANKKAQCTFLAF